jgi:hypothetical protein
MEAALAKIEAAIEALDLAASVHPALYEMRDRLVAEAEELAAMVEA